jgi:gliding motility-associated protein GldM
MNDEKKVGPYWEKAQKVREYANATDEYIHSLKKVNILFVEKWVPIDVSTSDIDWDGIAVAGWPDSLINLHNTAQLDNYDIPTNLMIGGEPTTPKEGPWTSMELKGVLQKYKDDLTALFSDDPDRNALIMEDIEKAIEFKGQKHGDVFEEWEVAQFNHLPLAAVITNLSKMQADVRSLEADVVKELLGEVSADDFKFDKLAVKVIPNTNYVFLGDTFKAQVLVAALSTTQDPVLEASTEIDTTGGKVKIVGDIMTDNISVGGGMGIFSFVPTSEGNVGWGGVIKIKKPDGSYQGFDFKHAFTAAKPALVVSPTAMNVMYRGLENPIEVSVPGVPTDKLQVSISNASKSGSNGKFKVKPGKSKECVVSVSANIDGETKNFGKAVFRCKNVPNPVAQFAGSTGGKIKKSKLTAAQGVAAKMENFEFDLKFTVISFVMSATVKGKVVEQIGKGNKVNSNMKTLLKALKPGQKVYLEKIKAKGPDGTVRDLGTIAITVI